MNRTFDFYEYAGIVIPGAVLMMALAWLFPEGRALFSKDGITLGEFGLFVILAYAAGQLVQAIGNYVEFALWSPWGGMPSVRLLCGKYLNRSQHSRIQEALQPVFGADIGKLSKQERLAIVREVYSEVAAAGKASRVESFNGSYGLMRGLAATFLVIFALAIVTGKGATVLGILLVLFLLALHRMYRYGRHYATELFIQLLTVRAKQISPSQ